MLCMAKFGQRYGPSGKPRPVEAAFQDEFYRCFRDELGPGAGIIQRDHAPAKEVLTSTLSPLAGVLSYYGMTAALLNIARGLNQTESTIKPYSRVSYPIGWCRTVDMRFLAIPVRHLHFLCPLLYR